jgi:hypothetical protein
MKLFAPVISTASAIAIVFAITGWPVAAQEAACRMPPRSETTHTPSPDRVQNYQPIFRECRNALGLTRLAIRHMRIDRENLLLIVDPSTLKTSLESEQCWYCTETDDEAQRDTKFIRAVHLPEPPGRGADQTASQSVVTRRAGLTHGAGDGSYITGDLCPSRKPLDRGFFERLAKSAPRTPIALSISGLWLTRHGEDFVWLREQARSGAFEITWVNHSYHHPYFPGRPYASNFLLAPGVDMQTEILDTERLLIATGETPSVFFRFPGLVSDPALEEIVRHRHLVVLAADAWLAITPVLRPGAIVLVHPNGNEPLGLQRFFDLLDKGTLPRPFKPIDDVL